MNDTVFYDPLIKFYKSVTGAVKERTKVTFRIKGGFSSVGFLWHKDGEADNFLAMNKVNDCFELTLDFNVGLYWYCFCADGAYIGCNAKLKGVIADTPRFFQLSVYSADYFVPDTIKGGIIYQIFPDRFYRSKNVPINKGDRFIHKDLSDDPYFLPDKNGEVVNNDFFGGNLKGITEKLPYLKSLNVTAIYLNPIFKAFSNHRYDTGDYMEIDPLLGSEADFKELIVKAKEQNIVIILDGVFNHVGSDSRYFNKKGSYDSVGAYQSKLSPYYEWFNFTLYPDEYESWWGIKTLPQVNESKRSYIDFICGVKGVIKKYFDMGVKGIRLDVVDELPDEFVKEIRKSVKSVDKNNFIIGEVWEDASNKIAYDVRREYFLGEELDSVMNYPLKNAIIDFVKYGNSECLSEVIASLQDHYPKDVLDSLMNILSTHDTARILSAVSDENAYGKSKTEMATLSISDRQTAVFRLKTAVLLQYTLFGVPSVYYGDEAGAEGFFDPLNRRFFPWDNIDKDIFSFYEKIGKIRALYNVFKCGEVKELYRAYGLYAFIRKDENKELLIIVNVKDGKFDFSFNGELINLLDGKRYKNKISVDEKFLGIFENFDKNS